MFFWDKEQLEPILSYCHALGIIISSLKQNSILSLILKWVLFDSFPLALEKVSLNVSIENNKDFFKTRFPTTLYSPFQGMERL